MAEDCLKCSVRYYSIRDTVKKVKASDPDFVPHVNDNILSLGPVTLYEIRSLRRCVKSCPATHNGKNMIADEARRECVHNESQFTVPKSKMNIQGIQSLYETMVKLKTNYDEILQNIKPTNLHTKIENRNERCNFNGMLRKRERGNYESYYYCKCDESYIGDNCHIPLEIAKRYQNILLKALMLLKDQSNLNDHRSSNLLIESLLIINKFKIDTYLIETMLFLIKEKLLDFNRTKNYKKLYKLYDLLFINIFDILEDQKNSSLNDIDVSKEDADTHAHIFKLIKIMLSDIEGIFEDSKLNYSLIEENSDHFLSLNMYSLTLAEYKFKNDSDVSSFIITNPHIDKSEHSKHSNNWIEFEFHNENQIVDSKYHLQVLNISMSLFEARMKDFDISFMSHMMYLKVLDPEESHTNIEMSKVGITTFLLRFSLLFVPAYDNFSSKIDCRAYNFNTHAHQKGELVKFIDPFDDSKQNFNNEDAYAECRFSTKTDINSSYFVVVLLNNR